MNANTMNIASWDELIDVSIKSLTDQIQPVEFKFDKKLTLTIRVCGESWGGFIDYRGAQFILDLQKSLIKTYKELSGSEVALQDLNRSINVKVKIEEGSSIFNIEYEEALKAMFNKLSGNQITLIATLAILCGTGYFTYSKVLEEKHKHLQVMEDKKLEKDVVDTFAATMDRALDLIERKDLEAAPRKLTRKLDDKDQIQLPGREPMQAETVIKNIYPKKPKMNPESDIFDGTFVITKLDMTKEPIQFKLEKDGHEFWADAELSATDIKRITKNLENALREKKGLNLDLHLFIVYDKKKIRSAAIVGTGEPRPDSKRFIFLSTHWGKNK